MNTTDQVLSNAYHAMGTLAACGTLIGLLWGVTKVVAKIGALHEMIMRSLKQNDEAHSTFSGRIEEQQHVIEHHGNVLQEHELRIVHVERKLEI